VAGYPGAPGGFGQSADFKSAIQQVTNLRYEPVSDAFNSTTMKYPG
jgi:hypothetical protein